MRPERGVSLCAILSLIGLGLAGYLSFLHLGLMRGELISGPMCGGSGAFNCHAVTSGAWSSLFGMPLALWGLLGYLALLALALLGQQSSEWASHAITLICLLALLLIGGDLALGYIMVFIIRYYCAYCLLTYAVNLILLAVAVSSLGRPWLGVIGGIGPALASLIPSPRRPATGLFWGVIFAGTLGVVGVHAATLYVAQGNFGAMRTQMRQFISQQPRITVDVTGDPSLGPADAPLRIVEFSDFFCPACQRASKMNTIILASHRRDVAFVFKNYPLDNTCNDRIPRAVHPGACRVAAAGECAHLQGKFWAFHDLVFEKGHEYNQANLEADAMRLGLDVVGFQACMASGQGLDAVKRDIAEAGKANVMSTPTYLINGVSVAGGLQPLAFEDFAAVLREKK